MTEKRYRKLRYILQTNRASDTLIICFSGFGSGGPARYNYIKTLRSVNANKLFILDNFGYKKQGSYYLGEDGKFYLPEMIDSLVKAIQKDRKIKQLVTIGSSKGGSAALYYAIKLDAEACIIGAPQYFIGDYLSIDRHLPILSGIMGDTSEASIKKLNSLMHDCISNNSQHTPKVYLHYSPKEHTYPEHIADMIADLKYCEFSVYEDADYEYTEHAQIAKHFPLYLLSVLERILS